jgi:ribonucleoside-diphosphate reductase alpha chain
MYSYQEAYDASLKYFNGSDIAAGTFVDKYALKDKNNNLIEKDPDQYHHRIAREFARIEKDKFKNPLSEENIYDLLKNFSKIIVQGSPSYGIGNPYQYVSISNCFVLKSPEDSYGGICRYDEELVQISKRRGGVGGDISPIRPNKTPTSNSSRTSTGIVPFMSRFSNSIREVGQDGRRGAEMITLSIHHPESVIPWDDKIDGESYDVEIKDSEKNFVISSKYYNPKKIDFVTSKYDKRKVTGANISLRLTDEFLNAVENNEDYEQRWPVDSNSPSVSKKISAKKVWDKIIYSAWQTAEPGILFWDNILRESPADCYAKFGFQTCSTNPCGEIPLSPYDSCRLLVLNLFGFVKNPFTNRAYFDYKDFYQTAKIAQRLMDDLVDLEIESINRIISKIEKDPESEEVKQRELSLWKKVLEACKKGRRTGTGITALGDTIAAINVRYGSDEGINITDRIYQTLKFACYESSVDMAEELGPFPVWDYELEKDNPFLNRIKEQAIVLKHYPNGGIQIPDVYGKDIYDRMKKFGRRNIASLTTAPVGTMSILTKLLTRFGCSSGIEPQYSIKPYIRRKKINPSDKNAKIDFVDQNGDHWQEFKIYPPAILDWMDITGETDITKSPWYNNCAEELDWTIRVKLQAAAQKNVDHSISSTVNLPQDATIEDVAKIYNTAWKSGCKGITVYRDKCRTGVLIKEEDIKPEKVPDERPKEVNCDVHYIKVRQRGNTEEYFVLVGIINKQPYEVFCGKDVPINKNIKNGKVIKYGKGHYKALFDDSTEINNIQATNINETEEGHARMISLLLRSGASIHSIVQQLEKVKGDMQSFSKSVSRALKTYIPDGTEEKGEQCPECKSKLVRQQGCIQCLGCGWTKCS